MIGQAFESRSEGNQIMIIGVVKDFKLRLDQNGIGPLMLQNNPERFKYLNVKMDSWNTRRLIRKIGGKWKTTDPVHPFNSRFLDDQIAATSRGHFDIVSILGFLSFNAVAIACLGLLGIRPIPQKER